MIFDDFSPEESMTYIQNILENTESIKKEDHSFNQWFEINKDNIQIKKDSILVIETSFIDAYEDEGSYIKGVPLFNIISFEDINDKNSKNKVLEVKIPFKLEINYSHRYDDTQKYCIFFIESMSNLFKSNMSEQNVDNSYQAVKELLDGKFNLLRQLNYEDIPFVLSDICSKNSIKGFQLLIYELMTMALSRELNDSTKEFRHIAKNKEDHKKFQMINVRDISRNTSAFSALASENISKSIQTALVQSKKERDNEVITPQEQIALGRY